MQKKIVGVLFCVIFVLSFVSIAPAEEPPPYEGCTLTPGYWKTHSKYGPAPSDPNWGDHEDRIFYLSGKTIYEVLWTAPAGNAYYILAPQYIAAGLNAIKGAWAPYDVLDALYEARGLLEMYTPAEIGALKGRDALRERFISLASILDDYNNGVAGPGHCTK